MNPKEKKEILQESHTERRKRSSQRENLSPEKRFHGDLTACQTPYPMRLKPRGGQVSGGQGHTCLGAGQHRSGAA